MISAISALLLLAAPPAAAAQAPAPNAEPPPAARDASTHSSISASTVLPSELASCIDHAVVELGLGAKKSGPAWKAKGELFHATIAKELSVFLATEPAPEGLRFRLHVDFPGAPKEEALQGELEARAMAAVGRAARICGITKAKVECARTPAGGAAAACKPNR